jgi:hypothetical protein
MIRRALGVQLAGNWPGASFGLERAAQISSKLRPSSAASLQAWSISATLDGDIGEYRKLVFDAKPCADFSAARMVVLEPVNWSAPRRRAVQSRAHRRQRDGLYGRMGGERLIATPAERVDAA